MLQKMPESSAELAMKEEKRHQPKLRAPGVAQERGVSRAEVPGVCFGC